MKIKLEQYPAEICLSAAELEYANLNEWESLEIHLLDQAAVVIPGQMTVMEHVRTAEALQSLSANLLAAVVAACEPCDRCQVGLLCDWMRGEVHPEVTVPASVLERSALAPDSKLAYQVDPETGTVYVVESDRQFDLTDIPTALLNTFRECGVCLDDLEEKMVAEEIVYGAAETEIFSE